MKQFVMAFLTVLCFAGAASAQVPAVKNPTAVTFDSVDHANLTGYEVDIIRVADAVVIQTINVAKAATTVLTGGRIKIDLNVQPISFGSYTLKIRSIAGVIESPDSPASDQWERSPGSPSKPTVQ